MQKIENHALKRASHGKLGTFRKSKDAVKTPQHLEAREPRKKHTKTNKSKNYSERVTFEGIEMCAAGSPNAMAKKKIVPQIIAVERMQNVSTAGAGLLQWVIGVDT